MFRGDPVRKMFITANDLNKSGIFIPYSQIKNYDGDVIIDSYLGQVIFEGDVTISGSLIALNNSGVFVNGTLKVSRAITSDLSVVAKNNIYAFTIRSNCNIQSYGSIHGDHQIEAGYDVIASRNIVSFGKIRAGYNIKAKQKIRTLRSIEAGRNIMAGKSVAARSIRAGFSVIAEKIFSDDRIFAGLSEENFNLASSLMRVSGEVIRGKIAYGKHCPTEGKNDEHDQALAKGRRKAERHSAKSRGRSKIR